MCTQQNSAGAWLLFTQAVLCMCSLLGEAGLQAQMWVMGTTMQALPAWPAALPGKAGLLHAHYGNLLRAAPVHCHTFAGRGRRHAGVD